MSDTAQNAIRNKVRNDYAQVAKKTDDGNCAPGSGCCGPTTEINSIYSVRLGYSEEDLEKVPEGADLGLGCGNPRAIASLKAGEYVLDLGAGAGFDCFLAIYEVGKTGRVIGVDMTPEMIEKARANAAKAGHSNVEFRLGEIEHLPVADQMIDVIISNCVINLSPDKPRVYNEAYRVLKPGGRLAISDVIATAEVPDEILGDMSLYSGCMSGASTTDALSKMLTDAGFFNIAITPKDKSREFIRDWAPGRNIEDYFVSAYIEAYKP